MLCYINNDFCKGFNSSTTLCCVRHNLKGQTFSSWDKHSFMEIQNGKIWSIICKISSWNYIYYLSYLLIYIFCRILIRKEVAIIFSWMTELGLFIMKLIRYFKTIWIISHLPSLTLLYIIIIYNSFFLSVFNDSL